MSNVVCLMNVEADRATFTWSEGPASFEPYTLDGMVYKDFQEIAAEAREKLADLVKDYLFDEQNMPKSAFVLAEAGHELYQAMFDPGAEQARQARQVRKWLEELAQQHEVDTLEIVVESPWSLPWNIIYDREPEKEAFLSSDESPDRWKPFWGLRYNLAGGRKVDPLRRMPLLREPKVLLVVDPEIRDGLPEAQQKRLADFSEKHQFKTVHNKDELQEAVNAERPELLYWLSHAEPDALVLAGEPISPRNMRKLLRQDDDENFGGLAFLNACQTAEGGESGSFFEAFHSVGFAGMIGTEHQTVDQFANPLGLDFLEAFLDHGEPVGSALRKLRGRVPLGLLYGTYCPPDIRVDSGNTRDSLEISQVHTEGVALSVAAAADETATRTLPPLPDEPYRSLAYYDREDRALFAGRDDDIERFATYLDDATTRVLVLHGESGVGKSSFLRAGVIPYLEEECLGYRFVREQAEDKSAGAQGSVIFIRATNDLFGQLAQALCEFCARPYEYQTPLGEQVSADLPGVLRELVADEVGQAIVRALLRSDPSLLGRIMAEISNCLPFTAILVIDQGEEVFTLAQTPEDQQRGRQALDMLRRTVGAAGDFKVIFSLRTEYYGRVIDRLRRGLHDTGGIREYLLTDFDEQALIEAIRRPTADVAIPYTADVPFEKYGFRYAEGVAEEIAHRVVRYTTQRRDSVLPLMQVICTQLYRLASQRADKTIALADLDTLGGIEGGMRNHVEGLLGELLKGRPLDKRPVQKLFTQLYLKQPDGTLTTALLAEDEVQNRWTGRMSFGKLLQSCCELRLLKVNTLRIGMEEERRYVSLGHDAMAKLAVEWDEELTRHERFRKTLKKVAGWASAAAVLLLIVGALFVWMRQINETKLKQADAEGLVKQIVNANIDDLPKLIDELPKYRNWADPLLRQQLNDHNEGSRERLHVSLGLLPVDPNQIEYLQAQITTLDPQQLAVVRDELLPHKDQLAGPLWSVLKDEHLPQESRFNAACALAAYDAGNDVRWHSVLPTVALQMVLTLNRNPRDFDPVLENLHAVRHKLSLPVSQIVRDAARSDSERDTALSILLEYASDDAFLLADVLADADARQFEVVYDKLRELQVEGIPHLKAELNIHPPADASEDAKEHLAKRQANAAIALLRMDHPEKVWPLLKHSPDPRARTYFIHSAAALKVDPLLLVKQFDDETDVSIRGALLLTLGEYSKQQLPDAQRTALIEQLLNIYEEASDLGLHAAAEWLLRKWEQGAQIEAIDKQLAVKEDEIEQHRGDRAWYVNSHNHTMILLQADTFLMGSPPSEPDRQDDEVLHQRKIGRRFAIASKEVTKAQFARFQQDNPGVAKQDTEQWAKTDDSPQVRMTWYEAAWYCSWLSEREGIPKEQWCYEPNEEGEYAEGMRAKPNHLTLSGYRLPTETEWEYACRAGTVTSRYYGLSDPLLEKYAWYDANGQRRTWPVGSLKPNDFGLFDMHGNVYEWCHERYAPYVPRKNDEPVEHLDDDELVDDARDRVCRGGSFSNDFDRLVRSAYRAHDTPGRRNNNDIGFRVARTYP